MIFTKPLIIDVLQGFEYVSVSNNQYEYTSIQLSNFLNHKINDFWEIFVEFIFSNLECNPKHILAQNILYGNFEE